jgi:hypothetical protein
VSAPPSARSPARFFDQRLELVAFAGLEERLEPFTCRGRSDDSHQRRS